LLESRIHNKHVTGLWCIGQVVKRVLKFELLNAMNPIISFTFEPLEKLGNLQV